MAVKQNISFTPLCILWGMKRRKKNPAAVALGRLGGKNSRKNLSDQEKAELGRRAVLARWERYWKEHPEQAKASEARRRRRAAKIAIAVLCLCIARPADGQGRITAVVNSATFGPDIAFSSIISIFGERLSNFTGPLTAPPVPTVLGDTKVQLCNLSGQGTKLTSCLPLGMLYVSSSQINAIVPDGPTSILEQWSGQLQVIASNVPTEFFSVKVDPVAPGIYREGFDCSFPNTCALAASADAQHQMARGAIVDQAGHLVSSTNPILAHQIYSAYMTGLGIPNNPGGARQGSPYFFGLENGPNGTGADVSYAGPAPGFPGLYQVNFSLPQDLRRIFGDGINLPICSTLTTDLKAELDFQVTNGSFIATRDAVKIPILVHPNELDCTR